MQFAQLLKPNEVEQIHQASLEILENIGVLVHNQKARDIYSHHGCKIEKETGIVKFPREVVENFRQAFVPQFSFMGRDPQFDRTIPDDRPVIITGSSAPNVIDPDSGDERRATSADIANIAYLINELPGYDVFSISTLADDAPDEQYSLARFYPSLKNCLKPVRSNTPNMQDLMQVLELGTIIAGGAGLIIAYTLGVLPFVILLAMSLLGLSYNLRLIPRPLAGIKYRRIRDVPGSKTILIAAAWGTVTAVLPALGVMDHLSWNTGLVFLWSAGIVFVRTAFFDILDMQGDRIVGKETLPILLGEKRSMQLLNIVLTIITAMLILAAAFQFISDLGFFLVICPAAIFFILRAYERGFILPSIKLEFLIETNFILAGALSLLWTLVVQ